MLQSVVLSVVKSYFGEFLEDIDAEKLQLGLWSGDLELKDCRLNPLALEKFDLPFRVLEGSVGTLHLHIPWRSLSSESVVIRLENILVLAKPLNSDRACERRWAAKQEHLRRVSALLRSSEGDLDSTLQAAIERGREESSTKSDDKESETNDGWFGGLTRKILDNIRVSVKNVHLRYEDEGGRRRPFAAGLKMDAFDLRTTDAAGRLDVFIDRTMDGNSRSLVHKLATTRGLAVYMTELTSKYTTMSSSERRRRAKSETRDETGAYLLRPTSATAQVVLNERLHPSHPRFALRLTLHDVQFQLTRSKLRSIVAAQRTLSSRQRLEALARAYRPDQSPMKSARQWWRYAATCVCPPLGRKLRLRHFLARARLCRMYLRCRRMRETDASTPEKSKVLEESLERALDIDTLIFLRTLAIRLSPSTSTISKSSERNVRAASKEEKREVEDTGWGGWVASFFTASDESSVAPSVVAEEEPMSRSAPLHLSAFDDDHFLAAQATSSHKHKHDEGTESSDVGSVCTADYDDFDDAVDTSSALYEELESSLVQQQNVARRHTQMFESGRGADYTFCDIKTELSRCTFTLYDKNARVIELRLAGRFKVQQRINPSSWRISLGVDVFSVVDHCTTGTAFPQLVRPVENSDDYADEETGKILHCSLILPPPDMLTGELHPNIAVRCVPLEIVAHRQSLETFVDFFTLPPTTTITALPSVPVATYKGKEGEKSNGKQTRRRLMDARLELHAPIIIVPRDCRDDASPVLILDLGHLNVTSTHAPAVAAATPESKDADGLEDDERAGHVVTVEEVWNVRTGSTKCLLAPSLRQWRESTKSVAMSRRYYLLDPFEVDACVKISTVCVETPVTRGETTCCYYSRVRVSCCAKELAIRMSSVQYEDIRRWVPVVVADMGSLLSVSSAAAASPSSVVSPTSACKEDLKKRSASARTDFRLSFALEHATVSLLTRDTNGTKSDDEAQCAPSLSMRNLSLAYERSEGDIGRSNDVNVEVVRIHAETLRISDEALAETRGDGTVLNILGDDDVSSSNRAFQFACTRSLTMQNHVCWDASSARLRIQWRPTSIASLLNIARGKALSESAPLVLPPALMTELSAELDSLAFGSKMNPAAAATSWTKAMFASCRRPNFASTEVAHCVRLRSLMGMLLISVVSKRNSRMPIYNLLPVTTLKSRSFLRKKRVWFVDVM
eukprot:g3297.t1